jgi:hypothetical protein
MFCKVMYTVCILTQLYLASLQIQPSRKPPRRGIMNSFLSLNADFFPLQFVFASAVVGAFVRFL